MEDGPHPIHVVLFSPLSESPDLNHDRLQSGKETQRGPGYLKLPSWLSQAL